MPKDYIGPGGKSWQKFVYTRAVTGPEAGLVGETPDHTLGRSTDPDPKYGVVKFECSCGNFSVTAYATGRGNAKSSCIRVWEQHKEEVLTNPNQRTIIGTIQRQKKPLQTVFVALNRYTDRASFTKIRPTNGWGVYIEADDANKFETGGKTKAHAMTKALKMLDVAERRGSEVVRNDTSGQLPRQIGDARSTVGALLAVEVKNMAEITHAIDLIDEVLLLVPLLEERKQQLEAQQRESLMALISSPEE